MYEDLQYLKARGDYFHKAIITKEEFNNFFMNTLSSNKSVLPIKIDKNFKSPQFNIQDAIDYTNNADAIRVFYYKINIFLGKDFFLLSPINFMSLLSYRIKNRLKRMLFKDKR